ncbi:MAG: TonB-dependent receptor [Deltaproteobacteria bacterium]|nr:TonB-dependent receptor [Deltaproteobacteria bacterium]
MPVSRERPAAVAANAGVRSGALRVALAMLGAGLPAAVLAQTLPVGEGEAAAAAKPPGAPESIASDVEPAAESGSQPATAPAVASEPLPDSAPANMPAVDLGQTGPADFEQLSLESMLEVEVTTASKTGQKLSEAPAAVTMIAREDFERYGWQTVAEALTSVPGLYLSSGRDYRYLGVRGVSLPRDVNSRVLVLIDGHTMNNPWSASGYLEELLAIPAEAVERIEVILGPSSSIYGSNAFLAMVNIISRRSEAQGIKAPTQVIVDGSASTLNRFRSAQVVRHRFDNGIEVALHGIEVNAPGPTVEFTDMTRPRLNRPKPTATAGVATATDYERGYGVGGQASWGGASVQLHLADRLKGLPEAPDDSIFDDPYNASRDSHNYAEASYRLELFEQTAVARVYFDQFRHREFRHRDPTDWEPGRWFSDDPYTVSEGNDDAWGGELQATLRFGTRDSLVIGSELQTHTLTQPTYELNTATGERIEETVRGGLLDAQGQIKPVAYWNLAFYAQNDLRLLSSFHMVLGLRYDYNSLFSKLDDAVAALQGLSPRMALVYSPLPELVFKVMYGEAFRNPSPLEAFYDDGASVCGNPRLKPERLRTVELVGLWAASPAVSFSASAFYTSMRDLLAQQAVDACYEGSGPRLIFVNRQSAIIYGGVVGVTARPGAGIALFGSFGAWQGQQADATSSQPLPNSPPLVATLGASAPLWEDKLVASARARLMSQRLNWTLDEKRPEAGYVLVDAGLTLRRLFAGLFATLAVSNALDVDYRDPVTSTETIPTAMPQDGISALLKVGYEY